MRQVCIALERDSVIPVQPGLTAVINQLKQRIKKPTVVDKPHRKSWFERFTSPKEPPRQSQFYVPSPNKTSQQPVVADHPPLLQTKGRKRSSLSESDCSSAPLDVKPRSCSDSDDSTLST